MKKILTPLLLFLLPLCSFTQVKTPVTRSSISFQIKNLGINTQGTIGGLQTQIHFAPADLGHSNIEAFADVNTLNTDNTSRDEHLKSEDFFDVARYPRITIKSVSFKRSGANNYTGQFNLTIKDRSKLVQIPFTYVESGSGASFKGTLKIKRSDFGIGGSSMILSDDATIFIEVSIPK